MKKIPVLFTMLLLAAGCGQRSSQSGKQAGADTNTFPPEMIRFTPYEKNPVFAGTGADTWDQHIRERGYILKEDSIYKMWYTGYRSGENEIKKLGKICSWYITEISIT